jgi:hypothetical protein
VERDAEIAQIQHDLQILRARHASYERWGKVLRAFFVYLPPLTVLLIAAILFMGDPLMGVFVLGLGAAIVALIWLAGDRRVRWIDVASQHMTLFIIGPGIPFTMRRSASDALLIEEQIAERERRLLELGVSP